MAMRLRCRCCNLKPETNLALMLCLVFYLYVCLGGALFLLLEGQFESTNKPRGVTEDELLMYNLTAERYKKLKPLYEQSLLIRKKQPITSDNLWNFLEATDFAYHILTGQGTGQTTRILRSTSAKISYIFFIIFGIPITILTFRATGKRINIFVYALIRYVNVRIMKRQVTPNVHVKGLTLNFFLFAAVLHVGSALYMFTQSWSYLQSTYYTMNVLFTIGNGDSDINEQYKTNSSMDKIYRVLFNFYSFLAFSVLSSFAWSAHLFTRHMRFKAQNNQLARNNGETGGRRCPWIEVTRSQAASPCKSARERDTDRESVC